MMIQKILHTILAVSLTAFVILFALPATAKVAATEAEQLKNELTPMGSERAGNADGTIPAWQGGLTSIPANLSFDPSGTAKRPDPFADDKVLFTITAQNMDQYADKLSDGLRQLFKKYPDTFKMDIYPSRRTAGFAQKVYDEAYRNALEAELINDGSDGFTGAFGAWPFPIPQNGAQAIYNHLFRYLGIGVVVNAKSYLVYPNGTRASTGSVRNVQRYPYFIGSRENFNPKDFATQMMYMFYEPARRKGEIILSMDRTDYTAGDRGAWQYLPGQRRVRRAPSIAYDTPAPSLGGYACYDDTYVFNGKIDRFDWKLSGKKEMFIPYNNYQVDLVSYDELLTPYFPNMKHIRWELHRVWINESTLKEGNRHAYSKRVIYQDEDSWLAVLGESYDSRGSLWRMTWQASKQMYDMPLLHNRTGFYFDFQVDTYVAGGSYNDSPELVKTEDIPADFHTVQNIRKLGRR